MLKVKHIMIYSLLATGIVVSTQVLSKAKALRYPVRCEQSGYQFRYYTLMLIPTTQQRTRAVYFIYNKSNRPVTLLQSRSGDDVYVMHINNTIKPKQWGTFATSEKEIKFICTKDNKRGLHNKVIDCSKVLKACEYPSVKFGDNNRGNYWVVESNSRRGALRATNYNGILLLGPTQPLPVEAELEE